MTDQSIVPATVDQPEPAGLPALRRLFDGLVMRHVLILSPALSVRSERYQVVEGKTPEITVEHARRLLKSIAASHDVGRRDFAVIGILIYMAARAPAVEMQMQLPRSSVWTSGVARGEAACRLTEESPARVSVVCFGLRAFSFFFLTRPALVR